MDKQQISEWYRKIGEKGKKPRWRQMTKEERSKEMSRVRRLGMEQNAKKAPRE